MPTSRSRQIQRLELRSLGLQRGEAAMGSGDLQDAGALQQLSKTLHRPEAPAGHWRPDKSFVFACVVSLPIISRIACDPDDKNGAS